MKELTEKDIKITFIIILHMVKVEENMSMIKSKLKIYNISKLPVIKNTIPKIKNRLNRLAAY